MHRPPKVSNLQLSFHPEQQVLRLDVAVNHVLGVAVRQGLGQLLDVEGRPCLVKLVARLELFVELAFGGVLQDQVDAGGVVKVGVEPEDVRVLQV